MKPTLLLPFVALPLFATRVPIPISGSATPTPQECAALFQKGIPVGHQALRQAPEALKIRIRENWRAVFNPRSVGWNVASVQVLLALDADPTETKKFVSQAILSHLTQAPMREGRKLLSDGLSLPADPDSKPITAEVLTTFTQKYQLEKYGQISQRVLTELLPPEYSRVGIWAANQNNEFSTVGMGESFHVAHELGLKEEMGLLLMMMVAHEKFDHAGNAAQRLGDDDLLYKLGLYALGKFYFDVSHPYHYNKLWDAVEILKRIRPPEKRAEVAALFVDLTDDVFSQKSQEGILQYYQGDKEKAGAHMGVLAKYLLRGLKSSGDILFIRPEDSIKMDVVTRSSDPAVRAAIRKCIAFLEARNELIMPWDLVDYLMVSQDREELSKRAAKAELAGKDYAALYYAGLGDLHKAAALFRTPASASGKRGRTALADTLFRLGKEEEFRQIVHSLKPQLASSLADISERFPPEQWLKAGSYVDGDFRHYLAYTRDEGWNAQKSLAKADSLQKQGDHLNAGGWYMRAAFGHYLGDPLEMTPAITQGSTGSPVKSGHPE